MRIVADRYVLLPDQRERAGGPSTVFKTTDSNSPDGQLVAVKLISRANADETHRVFFRREVEALGRLSHPNIVSLLDQGEDEGEDAFYLVFEWMERRLRDVLLPAEELGWDDFAERWGLPLLDALAYAHERDVVHRDVKPTNILVGQDGTPLLADFGISKIRTSMVPEATVGSNVCSVELTTLTPSRRQSRARSRLQKVIDPGATQGPTRPAAPSRGTHTTRAVLGGLESRHRPPTGAGIRDHARPAP